MITEPPPDHWPPVAYGPYVALKTAARWLVALDRPAMAEARRITSLDDIIRRFRGALEQGCSDDEIVVPVAAVIALSQGEPVEDVAHDYGAAADVLRALLPAVGRGSTDLG